MFRSLVVTLMTACVVATAGCSLSSRPAASTTPSPAAIGDTCLIGKWNLQKSVSTTGYTYNGEPVRVVGLQGATMTFNAEGTGVEDFSNSAPLVGQLVNGSQLSITLRGTWPFSIHAAGHEYVETGPDTPLPTRATLDGAPIENYASSYTPATGRYTCTFGTLTLITDSGVQTDQFSRG